MTEGMASRQLGLAENLLYRRQASTYSKKQTRFNAQKTNNISWQSVHK